MPERGLDQPFLAFGRNVSLWTATGARWLQNGAVPPSGPNIFARQLFAGLPPRYDILGQVLSFGQDRRWRRAMVDTVLADLPARVLDVATGTAGVALQLASRAGARVVGVDLTPEMLAAGAAQVARSAQAGRVTLALARGEQLPFPDACFDALTFTYLLRYVESPEAALRELARVVKPGGIVANLEFAVPRGRTVRWLWHAYTRLALPMAGLVLGGREWYKVGKFLGPSIASYYHRYPLTWHEQAWEEAGLRDIDISPMSLGGGVVMWARKASPVAVTSSGGPGHEPGSALRAGPGSALSGSALRGVRPGPARA